MSQDLFAAFVGNPDCHLHNDGPGLAGSQAAPDLNDDDWGEFEAAETTGPNITAKIVSISQSVNKHQYSLDDLGPSTSILQRPAMNAHSKQADISNLFDWTGEQNVKSGATHDENVLFDANEANEEDGFCDFEEIKQAQQTPAQQTAQYDLLGLDDETVLQPKTSAKDELRHLDRSVVAFGSTTKQPARKAKPNAASLPVAENDDENWDDFSAWDSNNAAHESAPNNTVNSTDHGLKLSRLLPIDSSTLPSDATPPTNVPPPAVILSIFISIFAKVEDELLKPAASQPLAVRHQIYSAASTATYLASYIKILAVLARIIAARKLRWKRDTILAQSMRIGSASAGRVSGMKVTSIDKSELQKEDGEVAEAVAAWSAQAGRVKTAVHEARKVHATAAAVAAGLALVPDIKEIMSVKTLKEADGAVPSAKGCALCGLKREERVAKVDIDVLDSFGEWWIETTNMHTSCRDFWSEYEVALRQR